MASIAKRLTAISIIMTLFAMLFLTMINGHNPILRMRQDLQTSIYSTMPAA
ncbi:hypothetical protein H4S14_002907 [Agrobacterium vitis]|nr:hypothetical protein [Agrobacterium vitis]MBE1439145.1 hypothetical protein [Agrobacterium vitis]